MINNYLNNWLFDLADQQKSLINLPSKEKAQHFIDQLIAFLFPISADKACHQRQLSVQLYNLQAQLADILLPIEPILRQPTATFIVEQYFNTLPLVYNKLQLDAQTILAFDPAAYSLAEVILAYPGFYAIAVYRLAHELVLLDVPIIPRLFSEHAHSKTGIDIHPGASIGEAFFIDHGTGVVIGETTHIGKQVKIYQGVTLGALSVQKDYAQTKRHPTIEDNVIIYSGSTILGGNTVVGHSSIIGGNVWLTESVQPYSMVYHKSEVRIRNKNVENNVPIDFVI
ncbi:MAG: serine acetyltransferase [Chitinophagales bacterium]|jgi:serine O-acetyltransferase|nr:serine acetyltransferase [Chitinophagales bacterium]HNL06244.1 serine acetyltransferase [Chitinophagales bacterium]